jgi:threonine/homoserine/homoserine lactone efflux protein
VTANVWAFAAVAVPFVITPGASTAVVLRNSVDGGVRAGIVTALGVNAGSVFYGLITAFGVAAALRESPDVWIVLRYGGAAYLGWLGLASLRRAWVAAQLALRAASSGGDETSWTVNVIEGFATNALNPSIATFYLLVVPQFVVRGASILAGVLTLTAFHVAVALSSHVAWATAGGKLAAALERRGPRRALEAVTGVALLAFAIKLALSGSRA